jgi:hypothetical protein
MTEAQRVLRRNGWLVLHNDWFVGCMAENEEHEPWFRDEYLVRCPSPPRNHQPPYSIHKQRIPASGRRHAPPLNYQIQNSTETSFAGFPDSVEPIVSSCPAGLSI